MSTVASSRRPGADRRGGTTTRGMRWPTGKKARSRRLTAPRLELVASSDEDERGGAFIRLRVARETRRSRDRRAHVDVELGVSSRSRKRREGEYGG